MSDITILAGGWSASRYDLRHLPGKVIAVNDAALFAPRWDICLSMDRLWTEKRWGWIEKRSEPVYLRRSTLRNVDWMRRANTWPYENNHEATALSDETGRLDGTHSGFCALNLAYQLRPARIFLLGLDQGIGPRGERHWYPDYPWSKGPGVGRLAEWRGQFDAPAQQLAKARIEVFICSNLSPSKGWTRLDRQGLALCAS